uniref:Uncharacterized protein n=1 Tax=Ixodes ricinus TaxID=34613 RepID=A0A6B0U5Z6_IXORI
MKPEHSASFYSRPQSENGRGCLLNVRPPASAPYAFHRALTVLARSRLTGRQSIEGGKHEWGQLKLLPVILILSVEIVIISKSSILHRQKKNKKKLVNSH